MARFNEPGQSFLPEEDWRATGMPIAETWVVEQDGEMDTFMSLLDNMIGGLLTHPDHQGKGYGRALIESPRAISRSTSPSRLVRLPRR